MSTEAATNDNVEPIKRGSRTNHFGVCPTCRRQDGCHSIGPDHWYVCDTHKVKWMIGSDLFSCWRDLTPQERFRNADKLAGYREVEPYSFLKHGPPAERAAYRAAVAEVKRLATQAGLRVRIDTFADIIVDPIDGPIPDVDDIPF